MIALVEAVTLPDKVCKELLRSGATTRAPEIHPDDRSSTVNDQLGALKVQSCRTLYPRTRYIIDHLLILCIFALLG